VEIVVGIIFEEKDMEKFIKTQDAELAKNLRELGYKELKSQNKFFVFINNGKVSFSSEEKKKLTYTNKMEV
jgi:hypothetical protein